MTNDNGLGRFGIFSGALRAGDEAEAREAAAELEQLGYGALWIPGRGADVFERSAALLDATRQVSVGTSIVSIWSTAAADAAAEHRALQASYPGRFLLGLGVSHAPIVDQQSEGRYRKPVTAMREYLDGLDAAAEPVPASERVLAALAPKMLKLAGERTAGTIPYLTPPGHTRFARETVGAGSLVAPEQGVLLETDAARARAIARKNLSVYMGLPNYVDNWRRSGFGDEDFAGGGSDALVDALIPWGEPDALAARVRAHLDAGADHVCVQVIADETQAFHRDAWRAMADALLRA